MTGQMLLVIDTETTGVPDFKRPADDPDQPRLAGITMLMCDPSGAVVDVSHHLIRPDGWTMPPGAQAINGLTMDVLEKYGVPVAAALYAFECYMEHRPLMVAHSVTFDSKIIRGELRRAGRPDRFEDTEKFCTMQATRKIIGGSAVSLATAHHAIVGSEITDAHSSLHDAIHCRALYLALRARS